MLFIAINSGNPPSVVQEYVRAVKTTWPVYVDFDRSFEHGSIQKEISLQNICQTWVLPPGDGQFHWINGTADEIRKEMAGAKWNIDPATVPDALKKAWKAIEFGQAGDAVFPIRNAIAGDDEKVKAFAERLDAGLRDNLARRLADAKAKLAAGNKWEAYKAFEALAGKFRLYVDGQEAAAEMAKLRNDPKVTYQLKAKALLAKVQEWMASSKKADRDQIPGALKQLQEVYTETDAGQAARHIRAQ